MKTKKVRIAVLMAPDGEWESAGFGGSGECPEPDIELTDCARGNAPFDLASATLHWIEAEVPLVPYPITGTVVEDQEVQQ